MTIETRRTIELQDVAACEFVCHKCRAKVVRLLNREFVLPTECGNCQTAWITEGKETLELQTFIDLLMREATGNRPFTLRLEIKGLANG